MRVPDRRQAARELGPARRVTGHATPGARRRRRTAPAGVAAVGEEAVVLPCTPGTHCTATWRPAARRPRTPRRSRGSRSRTAPTTRARTGPRPRASARAPRSSGRRPRARRRRAMSPAPRARASARTAASTTPAAIPGRPAWTAPTTPAPASASSTGVQSATSTARPSSGAWRHHAVAGGGPAAVPRSVDHTRPAVALVHEEQAIARDPNGFATSARLLSTAAGSSPTCPPRLSDPKSPPLTRPRGR